MSAFAPFCVKKINEKTQQGFTIVELLMTLAIVGILISILIPAILGARQKSVTTATQAYVRNCLTAASIYALDHPGVSMANLTCTTNDDDGFGYSPAPKYVLSAAVNEHSTFISYTYSLNGKASDVQNMALNLQQ